MHRYLLGLLLFAIVSKGAASVTITDVVCTSSDTTQTIRFSADGTITRYQKPEIASGTIILRFVGVTISPTVSISTCEDISITYEQIREFLVFRIAAGGLGTPTAHRDGAQSVLMSIPRKQPHNGTNAKPLASSTEWALDVIVIDAGHGGKDVGAKGVNGVYEKDVTLSIARRLRALVQEKLPQTTVVMTRDDDTFIELYRRTQIANQAKGKLFVSIHCNSMPTIPHPAHGCETYILRPGRNEDAARVAERENASVKLESTSDRYAGLDADQLIVATMAQRSFVRFSEELAANIQKHVSSATGLANRGVNQAGFYVLVGASMPNVLFESAFLSNPDDAAYISSVKGQKEVAAALFDAILAYADVYKASLNK